MSNKGRNPDSSEITLWQKMTQGIKALHKQAQSMPEPMSGKAESNARRDKTTSAMDIQMSSVTHSTPLQGANGLDKRTKEKLIKGKMPIEGRIDLHGMTQNQAQHHLISFIQQSYHAQKRCVLVVTGKGSRHKEDTGIVSERSERGVLRARLTEWLYNTPLSHIVLSHSHATPRDGGSGAFYIYLKNRNKS